MKSQKGYTFFEILVSILLIAGAGGWVANIVKLISTGLAGGLEIARAVGIIVAPLGAVLGFF